MQPAAPENALQIRQIGVLVVVDEQQIDLPGAETVLVRQRIECLAAIPDAADHAGNAVVDTRVRPNPAGHFGIGRRELDAVHLRRRGRAGDSQRAVAAVGAEFERSSGVRTADGGVEQLALLDSSVANLSMVASTSSTSPRRALASTYAAQASSRPSPNWPVFLNRGRPIPSRHTDERRNGIRRFKLTVASLDGCQAESAGILQRVCSSGPIRTVKLSRMFAMPLCLTTDGGA